ncbi:hypothetical protein BG000_006892 [Podila horticola]|nr:hypothetical protein BG000_006892 [Podila horticola]
MVKFFAVVALVVAAMTAEAAVVAPVGYLDVNPVNLLEKRRDCCKTTYVKCELFKQSLRNPGAYRAIFKDPENNRHLASFDFNGLSPDWVQECSAGYCYAVRGSFRTCKFWVDDSRVGECETKGWFYETCTASFCNIYC